MVKESKAQIIDTYYGRVEKYLTQYATELVSQARAYEYSVTTRNLFLVAVGAKGLLLQHRNFSPAFRNKAYVAIRGQHGLLAVESQDPDMPYWLNDQWKDEIQKAQQQIAQQVGRQPEESLLGYLEILDAVEAADFEPTFSG